MRRELWLEAAPASAAKARAVVREAAGEQGVGASAAWDLMLAVTEAVTNAIVHGQACPEKRAIRLLIEGSERGLYVEVCDCGSFIRRSEPPAKDGPGGRGIPLMSAVTDDFELMPETGGTRVRFGKRGVAAAA